MNNNKKTFALTIFILLVVSLFILLGIPNNPTVQTEQYDNINIPIFLHPIRDSGELTSTRSNENILSLFSKTQNIWDQANIVFDVNLKEITLNENQINNILSDNYYPFYNSIENNGIHVFFINNLKGANGVAISPSIALVADITTVNDFRATAHEIGHLLGIKHSQDINNLLFQGANGIILSREDVYISRYHSSRFNN